MYLRCTRRIVIIRRGAKRNLKQAVFEIDILRLRLFWYMYGAFRMQNTNEKHIQVQP